MISSHFRTKSQGAFSLVELLAVIAIMGILAVLTVAAFRSMLNSDSLNTKTSFVFNLLTLARTQAIRLRTPVQLRVVTNLWQAGAGANDYTSCYRKVSLWSLQQFDPSNTDNASWIPYYVQLTAWKSVGPNVVFEMAANPITVYTFSAATTPNNAYSYFLSTATVGTCLPYLSTAGVPTTLTASPAINTSGVLGYNPNNPSNPSTNITADWVALEFLPTGALNMGSSTATNIYMLLTTGTYNGATLTYTQKSLTDWAQIRISSLTGTLSIVRP